MQVPLNLQYRNSKRIWTRVTFQKEVLLWVFERAFELGHANAMEYYNDKLSERVKELADMSPDQLAVYSKLLDSMNKFEATYDSSESLAK